MDLAKGTIENPPQGVRLEWAEKRDAGWVVSFSAWVSLGENDALPDLEKPFL